jgi:hypothetical protein
MKQVYRLLYERSSFFFFFSGFQYLIYLIVFRPDELHPRMGEERLVTEVPSSLKQLARLVVRGFYTIEDALIVDMLVRNPCEYIRGVSVLPEDFTQVLGRNSRY